MKIGILTFHREINKGAVVQSYCLQQKLGKQFPNSEVEIVDYRPPFMQEGTTFTSLKLSLGQLLFQHIPDYYFKHREEVKAVQEFIDSNYNLSSDYCESPNLTKAANFLQEQGYDAIFVGSDIVWSLQEDGGIPSPPNLYMLPNLDGLTKVGFAASTDDSDVNLLEDEQLTREIGEYISDFDFISVRDRYSQQRLVEFGVSESNIHYMPDPTILTDISDLVNVPRVSWNNSVVGVEIADFSMKKRVSRDLRNKGYRVVNLLGPSIRGQSSPPNNLSLQERVGLYQQLDLLVTNRFHGSIFTLKTSEVPVVYIEQSDRYPKQESKVRDLYLRLGIEEQILRYEGTNSLYNGWITDYVEQWEDQDVNIDQRLDDLQKQGEKQLEMIENVVNNSG